MEAIQDSSKLENNVRVASIGGKLGWTDARSVGEIVFRPLVRDSEMTLIIGSVRSEKPERKFSLDSWQPPTDARIPSILEEAAPCRSVQTFRYSEIRRCFALLFRVISARGSISRAIEK